MANRYWVGAGGNWSDTAHWSTTSGGTSGASVPGSADIAIFDTNSNSGTTAWTVTVDVAATITTLTVSVDAVMTLASAGNLTVTTSTTHAANSATNGVLISGSGASLGAFTLTSGTFNLNGSTVTMSSYTQTAANARTLAFGTNGVINLTGNNATIWNVSTAGTSGITGTGTVNCTYTGSTGTRTILNTPDTGAELVSFGFTGGQDTVTFSTTVSIKSLDFTGFSGTCTNTALSIFGSLTLSPTMAAISGTNTISFVSTTSQTITSNGSSLDCPVNFNGSNGTWVLQDNFSTTAARTITHTLGTIDLTGNGGNWTLSGGIYAHSGTLSRKINFGTGKVQITGNATTVLSMAITSGFTYTGTPLFEATYNGSTGTRTFNVASGGGVTELNAVIVKITGGSDIVALTTASSFKSVDFNTFAGTFTQGTGAYNLYGDLTFSPTMTYTVTTGKWTFLSTSAIQKITSNGKQPGGITINGAGGIVQLQDNLTAIDVCTLTAGTLDLTGNGGNWTYTMPTIAVSGTGVRSIVFGTGKIVLSGSGATIWGGATLTNFTYTGTPRVECSYSGATSTRTIAHGSTAGGTESVAVSFYITGGTDIVATTATSYIEDLSFSGFSGTLTNTARNIYGNLVISSGMTVTAGLNATTFAGTGGTQTITTNGKTLDFPVTFSGTGTYQLQDNCTIGSTRTTTFTSGTLDLTGNAGNWRFSTGLFSSSNSNTRAIAFGTGDITTTSTGTVWDTSIVTNFSRTGTPTVRISNNTATAITVNTGAMSEAQALSFNYINGTYALTDTAAVYDDLIFTGFAGTIPNSARTIYGSLTISSGMTVTAGTNATTFARTSGTQIITTNGKTLDFPLTFNGAGGTFQLADNLTMGTTRTATLTAGTLNVNSLVLSTGLFSSSNSNTRGISFGTGQITLTSNGTTIWDVATATGLTITGTPLVVANTGGSATTRTFSHGNTAGGSESNSVGFSITSGTDTVVFTATSYVKNLSFTGFSGTWTNGAMNIYGSLTISTGMTVGTGTGALTFGGTSGTQTITTNGKTLDFPITFDGVGGTFQLADNCTIGSTRTTTLTNGTFSLSTFTFSTALFSSNNSNTRSISFGTGKIQVTATTTATIWDFATLTNFSYTGTSLVEITGNASGVTRTINHGTSAGGSLTTAVSISVTAGTDTVVVDGSIKNLNFTGFSGSLTASPRNIYGDLTISTGMTLSAGSNTTTFNLPAATQTITSNGKTFDFPVQINSSTGTVQLLDNLTLGTTRTLTLTSGTLDLNTDKILSTAIFSTSNSNARSILFGTSGKIQLTTTGTATVWSAAILTSFSYTGTSLVEIVGSAISGTRTITHGTTGGTETNAISFSVLSGSGSSAVVGVTASSHIKNLSINSGVWGTSAFRIYGNLTTSASAGITSNNIALTFAATSGTQVITTNGKSFDFPITINAPGASVQLADNLTIGLTRTMTLTAGTLNLNNLTLVTGFINTSGTGVRTIGFGTSGKISLSANSTSSLWVSSNLTNFSYTGTSNIETTGGGVLQTFTIDTGAPTAAQALNWTIKTTAGTVTFTNGNAINNLTLNGTFTLGNADLTVYGNYTVTAVTTLTAGTNALTLAATSGTQTFNSGAKTHDFPIVKSGAGTMQLVTNGLNIAGRSFTLTAGGLDINDLLLSIGTFISSNTNSRSLAFGTLGSIYVYGNNATVWDMATLTNFTTTGTSYVSLAYSGSTGTRTVNHGSTAGGSESSAVSMIFSGTDSVAVTGHFKNLNFLGSGVTLTNTARTIYGNLQFDSSMTLTSGAAATTFAGTSGTQEILTNPLVLDFPVVFDGVGGTFSLLDNMTVGSTRTTTLTNGTLDTTAVIFETGRFASSNSNTRTILMGYDNYWTLSGTGTVWDLTTTTGLTFDPGTDNIVLSDTSTTSRTFSGGGLTYNNLIIGGETGSSTLTILGNNTFLSIDIVKLADSTILFGGGSTTTVHDWLVGGGIDPSLRNVTISSNNSTSFNLVKLGGGIITDSNYLTISYSNASPGGTWYAGVSSTNNGNNAGWIFNAPPNFLMLG